MSFDPVKFEFDVGAERVKSLVEELSNMVGFVVRKRGSFNGSLAV